MLRSIFRVFFALAIALSLAFGLFFSIGASPAMAGGQTTIASGHGPIASVPPEISKCYPSGYNRNGWRCGWRLAMAPYNLGSRYGYYYYNGYYYNYGYGGGYYYGQCPPPPGGDYGGRPRYGPCYNNYYYYPYYPYYPDP